MITVENKFARHGMFWTWTLPIMAILLLPMVISAETFRLKPEEMSFFQNELGRDVASITTYTNEVFKNWFVESGVYGAVNNFFRGGVGFFGHTQRSETIAANISNGYAAALWQMVYRGMWRINALLPVVWHIIICLAIPAMVDGIVQRAKKSFLFKMQNPVYFWTAAHSFILLLGTSLFIPITPIAISKVFILGFALALSGMAWITASNFQTGN